MGVEEETDSRTLGVGRKRDLQDASSQQDGERADEYASSDEELQRSRKRTKLADELPPVGAENDAAINTTSPMPVNSIPNDSAPPNTSNGQDDSLQTSDSNVIKGGLPTNDLGVASTASEVSRTPSVVQTVNSEVVKGQASVSHGGEVEISQAHGSDQVDLAQHTSTNEAMEGVVSTPVDSVPALLPQVDHQKPHISGWNGGVQGGLRTSFAAKKLSHVAKVEPDIDSPLDEDPEERSGENSESDDDNELDTSMTNDFNRGNSSRPPVATASTPPFKKLPTKEVLKLTSNEQQAYKKQLKIHKSARKVNNLHRFTNEAEKVLVREATWPLPQHDLVVQRINRGKTFYPKLLKNPLVWNKGSTIFDVPQAWNENGQPIKVQDFSFNTFAVAFARANLEKIKDLAKKDFVNAFGIYCKTGYYKHIAAIPDVTPILRNMMRTAAPPNALTPSQAMDLAGVPDAPYEGGSLDLPQSNLSLDLGGDQSSQQLGDGSHSISAPSTRSFVVLVPSYNPASETRSVPGASTGNVAIMNEQSSAKSFAVLSNAERKRLAPNDLAEYQEALMQSATDEADRAIKLVGKWPLPSEHRFISVNIAHGNTFYPRVPKNFGPGASYDKGGKTYKIEQVFNEEGLPIKAQDLSFNRFSVAFIEMNRDQLSEITWQHLKGAFHSYWVKFYNARSQSLMESPGSPGTFKRLEQAISAHRASHTPLPKANAPLPSTKTIDRVPSEAKQGTEANPVSSTSTSSKKSAELPQPSLDKRAAVTQIDKQPLNQSAPDNDDDDVVMGDTMPAHTENTPKGKAPVRETDFGDDIILQRKYFPSAGPGSLRCLACAGTGHGSANCPALECPVCSINGDHSIFTCPQNIRCQRCRQRGHQTTSCPEKLLPSKSEIIPCDICGSEEHLEIACHVIWRSFTSEENVRKVRDIPIHCYTCGGTDHYGAECGILTRPLRSGAVTWSRSNVQKYVDPMSGERAVSAGIDYSIKRSSKQFSIKGMGDSGDPYTIDDSEEEGEFIRPKVNNAPAARGHIRFGDTPRSNPTQATSSRRAPGMGFGGAYRNENDVNYNSNHTAPGTSGSYDQPRNYSSYNPGGHVSGSAGHATRPTRSSGNNSLPSRPAAPPVAKNKPKPKPKKNKPKKNKNRPGNGN